jgi:hypothetical protein
MNSKAIAVLLSLLTGAVFADSRPVRTARASRPAQRRAPVPPVRFDPVVLKADVAPEADLRPTILKHGLQVKSQGSRNTCSVFAITFLHEYMFATRKNFGTGADFSEEYLNYVKNAVNGTTKDGGFFDEIDNGYQAWGCYMLDLVPYKTAFDPKFEVSSKYMCVARKWPRLKADFIKTWDNTRGLNDAELQEVLGYLKRDTPIAVGLLWPNDFRVASRLGVPVAATPQTRDGVFDGHSVALVGFRRSTLFPGGGYVIFRNSGGTGFGDEGYGYLTFDYLKKYCNDALAYTF